MEAGPGEIQGHEAQTAAPGTLLGEGCPRPGPEREPGAVQGKADGAKWFLAEGGRGKVQDDKWHHRP